MKAPSTASVSPARKAVLNSHPVLHPAGEELTSMERRRFIVKAGGVLAAAGVATVVDAPNVIAQPKVQWRMSTAYTPSLDVLQGAASESRRSSTR